MKITATYITHSLLFTSHSLKKYYKCAVDGAQGNGKTQGTCDSGYVCNDDGSCSICAPVGITDPFPHSGCTTLNPICNGGTSCVCDPNPSLTCSPDVHSTCDGFAITSPFYGGSCICGTNAGGGTSSACIGELPSCKATNFAGITDATFTSATCQVKIETSHTQKENISFHRIS